MFTASVETCSDGDAGDALAARVVQRPPAALADCLMIPRPSTYSLTAELDRERR